MHTDCRTRMAKVVYATGIDYAQGSLAKPTVRNGHVCGTYLIGTHRTAPTENPNCTRLYVRKEDTYDRVTPISPDEAAARLRFSTVAAMVKQRKGALTKIAADQQAFIAQKDLPSGKKTLKAYYWKICGEAYDESLNG